MFAIINAIPAIALLSFGLFNHGFFPGLCFGAVRLFLSLSLSLNFILNLWNWVSNRLDLFLFLINMKNRYLKYFLLILWTLMDDSYFPTLESFQPNLVKWWGKLKSKSAISFVWRGSPWLANVQGLGITVFGMAYMFVHDGLVHRRFPVGPIAAVPYLRRVAAAHHVRFDSSLLFFASLSLIFNIIKDYLK